MNASSNRDELDVLGELSLDPPPGFADRLFASWVQVPAPAGDLFVAFTGAGISYVRIADVVSGDADVFAESYRDRFGRPIRPATRPPAGLSTALKTGRASALTFDLAGLSEFEQSVLRTATRIPRGEIRPYAWVAAEIGRPRAVRAVGSALGRNPVPVLIPCHRVTRSDGDPGEYVFGRQTKERILGVEHVDLSRVRSLAAGGVHFLGSDTTNVVCYPTCHHARRITEPHRHGFRTIAQATAAGYRPCKDCRPAVIAGG